MARPTLFQFIKFVLKTAINVIAGFIVVITFFQEYLIFPILIAESGTSRLTPAPPEVSAFKTAASDGTEVSVWRLEALPGQPSGPKKVAIIAHGNGGNVAGFYPYQLALQKLGYTSYGFDYRGIGESGGKVSETGIYLDIEAVWRRIEKDEKIKPQELTVVGISIGSGAAAYLANRIGAGELVLIAPFSSLTEVIDERPGFRYLKSFSRFIFPTAAFTASAKTPCVVIAYGDHDQVVSPENTRRIERQWRSAHAADSPPSSLTVVEHPTADHNSIFFEAFDEIAEKIAACPQAPQ